MSSLLAYIRVLLQDRSPQAGLVITALGSETMCLRQLSDLLDAMIQKTLHEP